MTLTEAIAQAKDRLCNDVFVQTIIRKADGTFIVMSSWDYALSEYVTYYLALYHDGSEVQGSQYFRA